MKICGILSWYDESPSWLATCVSSMGRFCDHVVAVDGAYALYPGGRPRSMPDQAEAIIRAAEAAEVGCTVHQPSDLFWGNEVEKRNLTLKLAGCVLDEEDWVCIVDADQYLMKANVEAVRAELAHTDLYVARYTVLEGQDMLADERIADMARNIDLDTEWTTRITCMYRWHPSLRYGPLHWTVSREIGGNRRWLWGHSKYPAEETLDLDANLVFYHRTLDRAQIRKGAQASYYITRDMMKAEKWEETHVD